MKTLKIVCLTTILCFSSARANSDHSANTFIYKNSHGSVLTLKFTKKSPRDGDMTGNFKTHVTTKSCMKENNHTVSIVGEYAGNVVSFIAAYPACGSIVSFNGNIDSQHNLDLTTLIIHQNKNPDSGAIGTRFIGHEKFIQQG